MLCVKFGKWSKSSIELIT